MTVMTIRGLDDHLTEQLRIQAARHGRSMEEEASDILRSVLEVEAPDGGSLWRDIRRRIEPLGGVDLELPPRDPIRPPPEFD